MTHLFRVLLVLQLIATAYASDLIATKERCVGAALVEHAKVQDSEVVVSGMGMGGAALARRLNQLGYKKFEVFDSRSLEDLPGGFGFILQDNGLRALDRLGLLDSAVKKGNLIKKYTGMDEKGNVTESHVMETPLLGLKRANLLSLLLEGLPKDNLHFQTPVKGIESSGTRKLLIASDGVGSKIRGQLHPELKLEDPGYFEVVGLADDPALAKNWDGSFRRYEDKDGRRVFGVFPAGDGQLVWYFRKAKADMPDSSAAVDLHWVSSQISGWAPEISHVISKTGSKSFGVWKPTHLSSLPAPYSDQGVFLLGDAAHPVLTFTSQGVSSAIEDAVDLADLFATGVPSQEKLHSLSHVILERSQKYIEGGNSALDHYLNGDTNDQNAWLTAPK